MKSLKDSHPIVSLIYFIALIGFSMVFMHPLCIAISLLGGLSYSIILKGKRAVILSLFMLLPLFVLTAVLNPVFNHAGVTVLTYLPSGNPLTLESLLYGLCSAGMLVSVVCHFSCLSEVMTGEKFLEVLGRISPSSALVVSMTFRFVPLFAREIRLVAEAQKGIGRGMDGNIIKKIKSGVKTLSIMITKSLENALESAQSMKSRGYGSGRRSSFSNFRFDARDGTTLGAVLLLSTIVLIGAIFGESAAVFFPKIKISNLNCENAEFFAAYLILSFLPIMIEIKEVWRWRKSR